MRYLSENDVTQMMGSGYLGEVRQGPDGNLYQYVQGVDGLGNPIGGFWSKVFRAGRSLYRYGKKRLPAAIRAVESIRRGGPGQEVVMEPMMMPTAPAATAAAMPTEVMAPAETETAGWGVGEIGVGPDGNLYQWVQGVDGLGNPIGLFHRLRRLRSRLRSVARRVQQVASVIPHPYAQAVSKGLTLARQAGVAGCDGLGALYQASDGTLYQVQGLAEDELRGLAEDEELRGIDEDEELRGFAEDKELRGLEEDEELRGLDEDEELRGVNADEELQGFAEDEELRGFDEDQEMQGIDGYVRQDGMSGLERFEPEKPPQTRWHVAPAQPPEVWKPLW